MTRLAYGRNAGRVWRAVLALMLATCGQAMAEPRYEATRSAGPPVIAGVPVAPYATDSGSRVFVEVRPALDHHLAGFASAGTTTSAGHEPPASAALDPIATSAVVRSVL